MYNHKSFIKINHIEIMREKALDIVLPVTDSDKYFCIITI